MAEKIPQQLQSLLEIDVIREARTETQDGFTYHSLPSTDASDYFFRLYIFDKEVPQIQTVLKGHPQTILWDASFEEHDFKNEADCYEKYIQAIKEIIDTETRVIQRKTFWYWEFELEVKQHDKWESRGKVSYSRMFHKDPKIESLQKIYYGKIPQRN